MAVGDWWQYRNGTWVRISTTVVDPPPPGVNTLYGASWGGASDESGPSSASFERINAEFGGLKVARYFPAGDALLNWTSFPQYLRDNGCAVIFTWSQYSPAQVIAGAADAALIAHFQSMPTDREIWSGYIHEVDDDIQAGTFTLADYWTAHRHIRALKDQYAPSNYHLLLSLNGKTFMSNRTAPQPYGFYWDNSFEAIGANLTQQGTGATLETVAQLTQGALDARTTLGVPLVIPELGVRPISVQNDAARAQTLSSIIAAFNTKASAICYYESFRGTAGPWNITEEPLNTVYSPTAKVVWAQAVSQTDGAAMPYNPPPPPPPPPTGMFFGNSQVQFDTFQPIVSNPTGAKGVGINTGFSMRRSYEGSWPCLFPQSDAAGDPGRGVMSHWSFTPGSTFPTQFLTSTTLQNQWRDFCNSWPQNHGGLLAIGHEPENNGYDLADYRAMQRLAYQIMQASNINTAKVKFGIITTNEPFRQGTVKQYYPQLASGAVDFGAFDYVGVDYYRYWRPTVAPLDPTLGTRGQDHPSSYWLQPVATFAQGHPVVIAEHASHNDPNNTSWRPSRFQQDLDYLTANTNCIAFDIYHSKLQPGHGPWWWHVQHCYPITSANQGTGVAPWNNNNPDDQTHPDNAMLNKLRQVLEAAPRYDQSTFQGWGF